MTRPRFVILGTAGHVPAPDRFDEAALLTVLGANSGNLMFQLAATRLIDADLTHISPAFVPYADTSALQGAPALIFPAANHLRAGADWTGLNNYLQGCNLPLVVLGLGAQAGRGAGAGAVAALRADPHVRRMIDILRERALFVTVRGAFSAQVCADLGLPGVEALGCPSALLNPDPQLGRTLAARLAALPGRLRTGAARLAVTAAAPFEIAANPERLALERRLFSWLGQDGLYIQQSGGVEAMRAACGRWDHIPAAAARTIASVLAPDQSPGAVGERLAQSGRFFTSAPGWIRAMQGCDLALGTRLHGTMAAIAAGCPGAIITHDTRTDELAETMHLPRADAASVAAAPDAMTAAAAIRFDGLAFDHWRSGAAARLTALFCRHGLPPAPHLHVLARTGSIRRTA